MKLDLSPQSWGRVIVSTVVGTALCVAVALYVDSFSFADMDQAGRARTIATDVFVPIILAVPLLLFFTGKLRELAIAHQRLTLYASTDSLTQVMNRAAFSTLVDAYLGSVREHEDAARGALLIIDADNFKSVNDRYGHDRGDEALRLIAQTIKNSLRGPDIVGRIGGEEFGVFLPGSDIHQAASVAERIRMAISDAEFNPSGERRQLTVSVGGASFERLIPFTELYRIADQRLYAAKDQGRNRSLVAPATVYATAA